MKKEQIRKYLIDLLDDGVVPFKKWRNRDTPSAQSGIATMRAYLKAGCDFKVLKDYDNKKGIPLKDVINYLEEPFDELKRNTTALLSIKYYEFEEEADWHISYFPKRGTIKWCKENSGGDGMQDWY